MTLSRWAFLLGLLSTPTAAEEPAGVPTQLPQPAGIARLQAVMELQATLRAAEMVADWFEDLLVGEARPPPR